jgi:AcrR family transcriptional regulator
VNLDSSRRGARERRSELRRSRRATVEAAILDAAEELIARHGLHGAALAQIARRAGVAVGTLYNYFTDRDALIRGLFESRRASLRPRLRAASSAGAELAFAPRLRAFVGAVFAAFAAHERFLKVAIENEHTRPPGSTTSHDLLAGVRDLVAAGVREGAIAPAVAELAPLVISAAIKAAAVHRVQAGGALTDDVDALAALLLAGVARPAGGRGR